MLATDVDPTAVACARENAVDALLGDLGGPLPSKLLGAVDVMTAVVPYVPTGELPFLARDVVAFEPRHALDGGEDGLRLVIVRGHAQHPLAATGRMAAPRDRRRPGRPVAGGMRAAGFVDIAVLTDEEADDRMIEGRRAPS